jgi:hypothetical protein
MRTLADVDRFSDALDRRAGFGHLLRALALHAATGEPVALLLEKSLPPHLSKSAVGAAAFDAGVESTWAQAFLSHVQPDTVLGRLAPLVIPAMTHTPIAAVSAPGASFVGQGAPAPLERLDADTVYAIPARLPVLVTVTAEMLKGPDPARAAGVLVTLCGGIVRDRQDAAFLSADARDAGNRPAGLLAAATDCGTGSPAALPAALADLWAACRGGNPARPFFLCSGETAIALATLPDADGGGLFRAIAAVGTGTIAGTPQIATPAAGDKLILVDAAAIGVCDAGLVADASMAAALQMADDPTNDATTGTATTMVSMFQTHAIALRLTRLIDWHIAFADTASYITIQ